MPKGLAPSQARMRAHMHECGKIQHTCMHTHTLGTRTCGMTHAHTHGPPFLDSMTPAPVSLLQPSCPGQESGSHPCPLLAGTPAGPLKGRASVPGARVALQLQPGGEGTSSTSAPHTPTRSRAWRGNRPRLATGAWPGHRAEAVPSSRPPADLKAAQLAADTTGSSQGQGHRAGGREGTGCCAVATRS